MNKRNVTFSVVLLFAIVLSGCQADNSTDKSAEKNEVSKNIQENGEGSAQGLRRPDFGQPEREADTRGIVKSIVGNEVSIYEVALGFGRNQASSSPNNGGANAERPAVSLTGATARPAGVPTDGGMGMGMGPGAGAGRTGGGRTAMLESLKEMSTGEAKIIIPIGIQMLKISESSSGNTREFLEASLSDITSNKTLTIWLDASVDDKKVAEFVLIN